MFTRKAVYLWIAAVALCTMAGTRAQAQLGNNIDLSALRHLLGNPAGPLGGSPPFKAVKARLSENVMRRSFIMTTGW